MTGPLIKLTINSLCDSGNINTRNDNQAGHVILAFHNMTITACHRGKVPRLTFNCVTALQSASVSCQLRQASSLDAPSCARLDSALDHMPHQPESHSAAVTSYCRSGRRFRLQHRCRQFGIVTCARIILPGEPVLQQLLQILNMRGDAHVMLNTICE